MKKSLILFVSIILCCYSYSQQTTNYIPKYNSSTGNTQNSIIYQSNDNNIGIGTESPNSKLFVNSGNNNTIAKFTGNNSGAEIEFINFGHCGSIRNIKPGKGLEIAVNGNSDQLFLTAEGNIGIGTQSTNSKLFVNSGSNNIIAKFTGNNTGAEIEFVNLGHCGSIRNIKPGKGLEIAVNGNSDQLFLTAEGNIGIGTKNTSNHKLAIAGKMIAEEVVVKLQRNWPDYVFEDNYNLMSLSDTEKFIQTNKHLPNVPSAIEVEENGISLSEMNAILLQKIEELTLHVINQQKLIDKLLNESNN